MDCAGDVSSLRSSVGCDCKAQFWTSSLCYSCCNNNNTIIIIINNNNKYLVSEVLDFFQGVVPDGDAGRFTDVLSHHVCFLQADDQVEFSAGMSQAVDEPLQSFLCVGGLGSIVGEEHLSQQESAHFCLGLQAGQVEHLAARSHMEKHSVF